MHLNCFGPLHPDSIILNATSVCCPGRCLDVSLTHCNVGLSLYLSSFWDYKLAITQLYLSRIASRVIDIWIITRYTLHRIFRHFWSSTQPSMSPLSSSSMSYFSLETSASVSKLPVSGCHIHSNFIINGKFTYIHFVCLHLLQAYV